MKVPVNKPYTITTQFGVPSQYAKFGKHSGIDYAVELNRTVYSPVDGEIAYARVHDTGGKMLMIKDAKGNYHRLMHNNSFIKTSGKVKQGEAVAKAGTTGLSTGVHVHHDIASRMFPISFNQFFNPNTYKDKEEDMTSKRTAIWLNRVANHKHNPSDASIKAWTGLDDKQLGDRLEKVYGSAWFKAQTLAIKGSESSKFKTLAEKVKALIPFTK